MKNFLFSAIALLAFCFQLNAQTLAGAVWGGSSSAKTKAPITALTGIYEAFSKGEHDKGWAVYSEEVALVDPTGNISFGKKTNREGFDQAMKSMDAAPSMKYQNMQARLLTNDVAIVVWDAEDEFKMGGQTIQSKSKCSAVLRKVNGAWKLEFGQLTPMLGMPALDADSKN